MSPDSPDPDRAVCFPPRANLTQHEPGMTTRRQSLGRRAEALVADRLHREGYTILARNWRNLLGELDIVAERDGEIVFVEVRARSGPPETARALALESVNTRKQARLLGLAEAYLEAHNLRAVPWRVDVAAVAFERGEASVEIIRHAVAW